MTRGATWRGAGRYVLLGSALLLLLGARARSDAWVGDFWIYAATVGELAARPFHPHNPLFADAYAFAFFSPYTQALGLVARMTGLGAIDVLVWQGLVNLALLGASLYGFVATWVRRPAAAFYALLFVLFLWGADPWLFSGFFHLRSLSYVLSYPSTFAAAVALAALAVFPRIVSSPRAVALLVLPVATLLWTVHPVTAMFLWVGLFAFSLGAPRPRAHWAVLAVVAAASFGLAMAWPLVPMRDLWFGQLARVHEGNDSMYDDPLSRIAPALLGLPWLARRLVRDRRDPLALFAAALGLLVVYGGVSGQWSYGRLLSYAVLLLHVALADALVSAEDRLARLPRGAVLRAVMAPLVAALMVAGSWPVVRGIVAEARELGDRRWLAFLEGRVGRGEVVLTDLDSCWYVPSFSGRIVAYPMKIPFVPDHDERLAAVTRFFDRAASAEERAALVARYDVRYVLLAKDHFPDDWADRLRALAPLGTSVYSSAEYELVRVGGASSSPAPMRQ
jgi:hypothetical protein